jgi:hypothetical protein
MTSTTMQLHAALIWDGEPIADVMLAKPGPITIGPVAEATFTVPDLGLPEEFAIVRPGERGYLLTMGNAMGGTVSLGGVRKRVTDLVGEAPFAATPVGAGDWGVVDLDGAGGLQLFFQVAPATAVLQKKRRLDLDTVLPAIAFSVLLHVFLLAATFAIQTGDSPFVWPGPRAVTGSYLATRVMTPPTPPPVTAPVALVAPPEDTPPAPPTERTDDERDEQKDEPRKGPVDKGREGRDGSRTKGGEVGLNSPDARRLIDNALGEDVDWRKWMPRGTGSGRRGTGNGSGLGILPSNPTGTDNGAHYKPHGKVDTESGRHEEPGKGKDKTKLASELLLPPPDDDVEIEGPTGLDPREINKRIVKRRGLFGACYQKALNRDDQLGGMIKTRFKIGPDGRVESVKITSSSIKSAEVKECLQRSLRSIKFPTSKEGAIVKYPFGFSGSR